MQSYASLHSPSVRKMQGQDKAMSRGRSYAGSSRMDFGNIIGDPFALSTISIAIVSSARIFAALFPLAKGLFRIALTDLWTVGVASRVRIASDRRRRCNNIKFP